MIYLFEECVLDTDRRELRRGVKLVSVEPQVFDFLRYLIANRDRVVSKSELIAVIWGGRIISDSAISSRTTAVRHAIGDSGEKQRLIRTIPRKGFRFVGDVREKQRSADVAPVTPASLGDRHEAITYKDIREALESMLGRFTQDVAGAAAAIMAHLERRKAQPKCEQEGPQAGTEES
jgi:DNA-binding winged helix-turn-helix (wHTH) protein